MLSPEDGAFPRPTWSRPGRGLPGFALETVSPQLRAHGLVVKGPVAGGMPWPKYRLCFPPFESALSVCDSAWDWRNGDRLLA